ncbi:MAG: hypothetical protein J3K34DRAFT_521444 [Monoraphidium minutum]|nr:MAG: hypothetical protein J3K34DRAFT_521444 [Monoraphidium minutum]
MMRIAMLLLVGATLAAAQGDRMGLWSPLYYKLTPNADDEYANFIKAVADNKCLATSFQGVVLSGPTSGPPPLKNQDTGNGPNAQANEYERRFEYLYNAGEWQTFGYIYTNYAKRPFDAVAEDVKLWCDATTAGWRNVVRGIMIDSVVANFNCTTSMPAKAESCESYYQKVVDTIKTQCGDGIMIMLNPGTRFTECEFAAKNGITFINGFEDTYKTYQEWSEKKRLSCPCKDTEVSANNYVRCFASVHSMPDDTDAELAGGVMQDLSDNGFGAIFLTENKFPKHYESVPKIWGATVAAACKVPAYVGGSNPEPAPQVVAPTTADDDKAKLEAEEKLKLEAEEKLKLEAEEKLKLEAEEKLKDETTDKVKDETTDKVKTRRLLMQAARATAALVPACPLRLRARPPAAPAAAAADAAPAHAAAEALPGGFDLGLGVAMAAAAFEAYLEPSGGAFQDVAVNGTRTTYTCRRAAPRPRTRRREFLVDSFAGVLEVTVESAAGLKAVNSPISGPGSDPYVVVSCANSSAATAVKWNTTQPVWGETFRLFVRDAARDMLRVRAFDKNKLLADVELGAAMAAVAPLRDGEARTLDLDLKGANGQGTVKLTARLLPFDALRGVARDQLIDDAVADAGAVIPGAAPAADDARGAGGAGAEGGGLEVGDAVRQASEAAIGAIEGAAGQLEARLSAAGVDGKVAEALGSVKAAALERAKQASDAATSFVESQGIASLPAGDLTRLVLSLSKAGGGSAPRPEEIGAAAAAASGAAAAAEGRLGLAPDQLPGAWKALAQVAGKALAGVFQPVAYVENDDTDTQVWVSRSVAEREVVVAFRGTEQVKWKDFVSDINLIPQTLDDERTGATDLNLGVGSIPVPMFKSFKKSKETMVHSGFLTAYDSVKVKVFSLVDQITSAAAPGRPWRVLVTGHSLGGALATLCAYELAGRTPKTGPGSLEVSMYTFGAPRVGNSAFAEAFNARLAGRSWRITNASDIVPSVPRLMGYSHVRSGVRLSLPKKAKGDGGDGDSSGGGGGGGGGGGAAGGMGVALQFEEGSKDVLGEGREVVEVITDLASKAVAASKGELPLDQIMDAVMDHEMQLLNALMDGSALSQHMEDFYLMAMRDALLDARPDLSAAMDGSALSQHMEDFYLMALRDALLDARPDLSAAVEDALKA